MYKSTKIYFKSTMKLTKSSLSTQGWISRISQILKKNSYCSCKTDMLLKHLTEMAIKTCFTKKYIDQE